MKQSARGMANIRCNLVNLRELSLSMQQDWNKQFSLSAKPCWVALSVFRSNSVGPGLNKLVQNHSKTRKPESKYSQVNVWREARSSADLKSGCGTPKEPEAKKWKFAKLMSPFGSSLNTPLLWTLIKLCGIVAVPEKNSGLSIKVAYWRLVACR